MKIINSRYKIDKNVYNDFFVEAYKVEDLWKGNHVKLLKIYHYNLQREHIDYLITNQLKIQNIKHKNVLHSEQFDIIKTIDMRETNSSMCYYISEYAEHKTILEKIDQLNFNDRLNILLDIMIAINFLHFRGFKYIFLNPSQVLILEDKTAKLQNITTIIGKVHTDVYTEFERRFLSPDFIAENKERVKELDYYSLARMIEYLFIDDDKVLDDLNNQYKKEDILNFFNHIIEDLENRNLKTKDLNLIKFVDEIVDFFGMNYKYDLIKERDSLFLENQIVGRDKEISKIREFDISVSKKTNHSNLVMVSGKAGMGKTRLLKEIGYRLKLKNRNVYSIDTEKCAENEMLEIVHLLRQTMREAPMHLKEKYSKEFSMILPELRLTSGKEENLDSNDKTTKYRVYNRIINYLKELSQNKVSYFLLSNVQNASDEFFNFLDYLLSNSRDSNIMCVLAFDRDEIDKNHKAKLRVDKWKENLNPLETTISRLNLEETGELIKNILGMAYIHLEFSTLLFKESDGRPKKIEEILSYLYHEKKLYMKENGKWTLDINDFSEIYIPNSIDGNILEQLSEIQGNYYEIIKTMSIFSDLLPKSILNKMLDMEGNLDLVLEELIKKDFIEEKIVDWGYSYCISKTEFKKLIYSQIEQGEKIELHKKAASAIEKLEGELYEYLFEELIFHLTKSMQNERALELILDKVEALENRSGFQAKYLLEKGHSILKESTESNIKLDILEKLIDISLLKEELNENDGLLEEYINLAESLNLKYHIVNYKRVIAEIHYQKGREKLFLQQIDEIKASNKDEPLVEVDVYCLTARAKLDMDSGKFQKAEEKLKEAVDLAIEFNLSHQLGNIYNMLGIIKYLTGKPDEAADYFEKSYEYYIGDKEIMKSVKPINNLANIYITHLNHVEKAIEHYQKGLDLCKKHGFKKMQTIFLINLSEVSELNYDYHKALEYVLEANKIAVDLQDTIKIAKCQSLLGSIYLKNEKHDKAYDCYIYLKSIINQDIIKDLEFAQAYYNFLGSFYAYFGEWDKSLKNNIMAKNLYEKSDRSQYYRVKFKIILIDFFKNDKFDKIKLEEFIEEYKSTVYVNNFRKTVLTIALLSISSNDMDYGIKYLEYAAQDKIETDNIFANKLRSLVLFAKNLNEDNMEEWTELIERDFANEYMPYRTMIIARIASIFEKQGKYKEAIKYNIEILENIYRNTMKTPTWSLKIAYIRSRDTDQIKSNISKILEKYYNYTIDQVKIEDIAKEENIEILNSYFDFTNGIEAIGKEEFSQIIKSHSYGETLGIQNIESLMSMFKDDYKYNLDLILNYLAKEALATDGCIIDYNKEVGKYQVVSSLNSKISISKNMNDGILKLAARREKGLLVSTNIDNSVEREYKYLLSEDITGVICVPIDINNFASRFENERRKNEDDFEDISRYIYIETNRVFNNFNEDILNLINSTSYLIYMNLEINKVRLIATTDKLTGAFTRKYYDKKFRELIENKKSIGNIFAVLMLDIDRFKTVNDSYGHRKGDQALKEIGATIKSSIRNTDIFGRYGGEEFVVLLKGIGEKEAILIGEKIRRSIESLEIEGIKNPITMSIGVSLYPDHSKFKDDLIEKADQALYHAKQTGRNKVSLWNHEMDGVFERVDKLAGILTGNSENDNKNILAIVQIVHLIEEEIDLKEKIYKFLGELLNIVDSETASLIILKEKEKEKEYYTRIKSKENFADTPILNEKIIKRVIDNKTGELLVDWDNLDDVDQISGIPNWKSVIVVPMIKNGQVKGLTYLTVALNQKEFDFNALNLTKNYAGIFTALL